MVIESPVKDRKQIYTIFFYERKGNRKRIFMNTYEKGKRLYDKNGFYVIRKMVEYSKRHMLRLLILANRGTLQTSE